MIRQIAIIGVMALWLALAVALIWRLKRRHLDRRFFRMGPGSSDPGWVSSLARC